LLEIISCGFSGKFEPPAFMPRLAFVLRANVDTGHMDVQIPVFAINSQSLSRNELGVVNFPF
jgi:hypothetical protein